MAKRPAKRRRPPAVALKKARDEQPQDLYEAEQTLPQEEQPQNINKRYDVSEAYLCRLHAYLRKL